MREDATHVCEAEVVHCELTKEGPERMNKRLTGGCEFRRRPQLIFENHLCCLTSEAPLLLPRRVDSFLSRRRVTMSLQDLHDSPHAEIR